MKQVSFSDILRQDPISPAEEKPMFFGPSGEERYGMFHYPSRIRGDVGVVMCPPLFMESMETHGVLVTLARFLAGHGYPVLRFDYRGVGESDGEWLDYSIPDHLTDIRSALSHLQAETGVRTVGLLGVRMGATLALISGSRCDPPPFVIALEPVVNGGEYVRELLRLNIAEQMRYRLEVRNGMRKLVETIRSGGSVMVVSFPLNRKKYEDLERLDLHSLAADITVPAAVYSLRSARNGNDSVRDMYRSMHHVPRGSLFRMIECPPFWKQTPRLVRRVPELFGSIREWLDSSPWATEVSQTGDSQLTFTHGPHDERE